MFFHIEKEEQRNSTLTLVPRIRLLKFVLPRVVSKFNWMLPDKFTKLGRFRYLLFFVDKLSRNIADKIH